MPFRKFSNQDCINMEFGVDIVPALKDETDLAGGALDPANFLTILDEGEPIICTIINIGADIIYFSFDDDPATATAHGVILPGFPANMKRADKEKLHLKGEAADSFYLMK